MKEKEFYRFSEAVEELGNITNDYFPTVEGLKRKFSEEELKGEYLPLTVYFASDPFTRTGSEYKSNPDYKNTVSYCKKILYTMDFG